jgi:hypothetical protein
MTAEIINLQLNNARRRKHNAIVQLESQYLIACRRLLDGETSGDEAIEEIATAVCAMIDAGWLDQFRDAQ